MHRVNQDCIPRSDLIWVLDRPDLVRERLQVGRCFLCSGTPINAAALCDICVVMLSPQETRKMERWTIGV